MAQVLTCSLGSRWPKLVREVQCLVPHAQVLVSVEATLDPGPRSPDRPPENRPDLRVGGDREGPAAPLDGAPSVRVDGASRRGSKASPPLKYLMALGSTLPEGQNGELGLEWVTHRETGRQAPDQRWEGCIPQGTLPQPVLLPPDLSGALPGPTGLLPLG